MLVLAPHHVCRWRLAVAFARNFASGLIQKAEPGWQQDGTNLTNEEMDIVKEEMERIHLRIEASVKLDMLARATTRTLPVTAPSFGSLTVAGTGW